MQTETDKNELTQNPLASEGFEFGYAWQSCNEVWTIEISR